MDLKRLFLVGFFSFVLFFQVAILGENNSSVFAETAKYTTFEPTQVFLPQWLKQVIGYWTDGSISDREFATSLGFLVKENVIVLSNGMALDGEGSSIKVDDEISIPDWIRNNGKWLVDDQISDGDFIRGIEFLINEDIISFEDKPSTPSEGIIDFLSTSPEYAPVVYEIQKWNEVSLSWLLEIDNFEEKQLDKESKEKWQQYAVLKNRDIMLQAQDLEEEYRKATEQTKSTLDNLKNIQDLARQAEDIAINNGAPVLDLEKSTKQQKIELEQVQKISSDKELKNAKDKSEKATKQATVIFDTKLAFLGYPNEKIIGWLDTSINNPSKIDSTIDDIYDEERCSDLPGLDCTVHVVQKSGHSEKSCLSKNESSELSFSWVLSDEYNDKIETPHRLFYVVTKDNVHFSNQWSAADIFGRINVDGNSKYKDFPPLKYSSSIAGSSILVKEPGLYAFSIDWIDFSSIYEMKLEGNTVKNIYSTYGESIIEEFDEITKKISGPVYSYYDGPATITINVPPCSSLIEQPPIETPPDDVDVVTDDLQPYIDGFHVIDKRPLFTVLNKQGTYAPEYDLYFKWTLVPIEQLDELGRMIPMDEATVEIEITHPNGKTEKHSVSYRDGITLHPDFQDWNDGGMPVEPKPGDIFKAKIIGISDALNEFVIWDGKSHEIIVKIPEKQTDVIAIEKSTETRVLDEEEGSYLVLGNWRIMQDNQPFQSPYPVQLFVDTGSQIFVVYTLYPDEQGYVHSNSVFYRDYYSSFTFYLEYSVMENSKLVAKRISGSEIVVNVP